MPVNTNAPLGAAILPHKSFQLGDHLLTGLVVGMRDTAALVLVDQHAPVHADELVKVPAESLT